MIRMWLVGAGPALLLAPSPAAAVLPDLDPPHLLVTLNDVPDDMNDGLAVPPDGFAVTLHFDAVGGSAVDPSSLSVRSSQDIGTYPAGSELAPLFAVTPSGAVWQVPAGSDLPRTTHRLFVSVADRAGNRAEASYTFAVRDFPLGAPLGSPQIVFLDFDQDRSLGRDADFLEDLREFGLSSTADPALEERMRDAVAAEIVTRAQAYYAVGPDGAPARDPVNLLFVDAAPGLPHSRLCVGGESSSGPLVLGAVTPDLLNAVEDSDECADGARLGVFPQAIDDLWSGSAAYRAAFRAVDPDLGGRPVGEDPRDATLLDARFDPRRARAAERRRLAAIEDAVDAFAQTVASAVAHETGHILGLTAPGPAPQGLWGGGEGGALDHNVAADGGIPTGNYLMNPGASFTFEEMSGRGGLPLPVFRPLNWAYLHDRVVVDADHR